MKKTKLALVVTVSMTATLAIAHSGATGIVKERMDGMAAMQKAVKSITPIMRGQTAYDADAVRSFAAAVEMHSGEAMTKLFPEGSGGMPSVAKPNIWSDWEGFEKLAMDLEIMGRALGQAADNGLAMAPTESSGSTMMGGQSGMGGMMGQENDGMMDAEMLAAMPADALFTRIAQTCASCHTKYRKEAN